MEVVVGISSSRPGLEGGPVLSGGNASLIVRRHHIESDVLNLITFHWSDSKNFKQLSQDNTSSALHSIFSEELSAVQAVTKRIDCDDTCISD